MITAAVVGASGYTGAELVIWLCKHPKIQLSSIWVSAESQDAHKPISELYPQLNHQCKLSLQPLTEPELGSLADEVDLLLFATPHEVSHAWVPLCTGKKAKILDLSGAFRLSQADYPSHYGFSHCATNLLEQAVYGLTNFHAEQISKASLISVPGCYPTASLLALLPVKDYLAPKAYPIVNAVSGVSGAGRKASLNTHLCEVSLQAYSPLSHRHQPEISHYLGHSVLFTPHLAPFKRGILATVTLACQAGTQQSDIEQAFIQAYQNQTLVRLSKTWPKLDQVIHSPYADLYWHFDDSSQHLVVSVAIDNLCKGAATQAIECANLLLGLQPHLGLMEGNSHE